MDDERPGYLEQQLAKLDALRDDEAISDSKYRQQRLQVLRARGPAKPRGRFYTLKWLAFGVLAFSAVNFVIVGGFLLLFILASEEEKGLEEWVVAVDVVGGGTAGASFHGYIATDSELLRVEGVTPQRYLVSRDDLDGEYTVAIALDSGTSILVEAKCNGFTYADSADLPGDVVHYVCWR